MCADPKRCDERAAQIVQHAWRDLPANDQRLLETIGASQWTITVEPVGHAVDGLLRSAGCAPLDQRARRGLDDAAGVWIAELRLVVINAAHPGSERLITLFQSTRRPRLRLLARGWGAVVARASGTGFGRPRRFLTLGTRATPVNAFAAQQLGLDGHDLVDVVLAKRTEKKSWPKRILDALLDAPG